MTRFLTFESYDLGIGLAADRPTGEGLPTDRLAFYSATDTGDFSVWKVDVWETLSGGGGGGSPTGPAGGDLGGTYPNPTVVSTSLAAPLPIAQGGTGNAIGAPTLTIADQFLPVTTQAISIDFEGLGVFTTSDVNGNVTVTIPGDAIGPPQLQIKDEGTLLSVSPIGLNFVGGGVTVTSSSDNITITIPGPSGAAGGDLGGTYPNPTVRSVANVVTGVLTIPNGGTGNTAGTPTILIKDEGVTLTALPNTIDFVGAGVTATQAGGVVTVTISGGGSGVPSIAGTANQIVQTGSPGATTLSIATTFTFPGTVTNNLSIFGATTSAQLLGVMSDETGTGLLVFNTSPTLITPALGTPSAIVLTNATGLVLTTGVTGILPIANGGTGNAAGTPTLNIKDEGVSVATLPTVVDFTGAGVTATNVGSVVTINIPGSGAAQTVPKFSATQSAVQTFTAGTSTKILFGTELFDTNNNFAGSTFTATIAGYYQFNGQVRVAGTAVTNATAAFYVNGVQVYRGIDQGSATASTAQAANVSALLFLNIADTVELWGNGSGTSLQFDLSGSAGAQCFFNGFFVGAGNT